MKRNTWFLINLILVLMFGCNTFSSTANGNELESNDFGNEDGAGGINGDNSVDISIPTRSEAAPSGVLEQLTWAGGGGGPLGSCPRTGCSNFWQGNQLLLRDFDSNQNLALFFYRQSGTDSCGNNMANFIIEYVVQVDVNGYLEINISGLDNTILLNEIRDANTGELLLGLPLGGSVSC